ncbi:LIM and calponin homology domains-containing protein 1 isoform X3 [Electrophorus electricus]|uniref:LIM and calponin homology domains-containing protein 1 isoform X3 n=1 Tax=Electrophorus electricus TaxID=8005 RepID=UPI0015D0CBEC|nr:LIM and calponin homology domains-containing protein 1 isoform X3 [Electrophorus electricus]
MASPASDAERHPHLQHHYVESTSEASEPAVREAQKWIEAVTGRSFGEKDFRGALDNGILLCELLSSVKPGLVKKINRLPTPVAGLDNLALFLRGCEELGLKGSQLFDPGDLQDTTPRNTNKASDCSRKLKNVLITIYWLGRAANSSATYNGPTLDLHEFEGLLSHLRKEGEEWDSPKRSIRDSGYIDCWESERSDSLSPPRHTRDDSFDSLDSIGSRSRHTPSPDGLLARGSSDGRGSDSECDVPHRKLPDVRRDDMLARRTSCSEPRTAMPFNQYLPNKSNQTAYMPASLRRQHTDREDGHKSRSSATSPTGGERPFRSMSMIDMRNEDDVMLPAHSPVRHELMHSQYNRMKEEESHWQDDLARWKSRRRSISQDLIKKEETRKMMEKLMKRDDGSQRRKSVKTYREIVEDKERRERELHEEYLKAKSPEEAAAVLQRYAQRFTISEAIMERLKLPRLLERSISADPTRGPLSPSTPDDCVFSPTSPSPLRYLRQQSLPAPKFTSTLEALVRMCVPQEGCRDDVGGASVCTSTPRPNGHSRGIGIGARPAEQDEMKRVNGEADVGLSTREAQDHWTESEQEKDGERKREGDSSPPLFYPSPSRNIDSDSTEAASTEAWSSGTPAIASTSTHPPEPEHPDRVDTEAVGRSNVGSEPQSREGEWPPSRPTFLPMVRPLTHAHTRTHVPAPSKYFLRKLLSCKNVPSSLVSSSDFSFMWPEQHFHISYVQGLMCIASTEYGLFYANSNRTVWLELLSGFQQVPIEEEAVLQTRGVSPPLKEEESRTEALPESKRVPEERSREDMDLALVGQNGTEQAALDTPTPSQTATVAKQIDEAVLECSQRPESASRLQPEPKTGSGIPATELASNAQLAPLSSNPKLRWDFFTSSEPTEKQHGNVAPVVLNLAKRGEPFAWDPEEERRRQERWQREQERMLQERYHREQEKLKQEWEKAQREVEEEERRFHEEERKILEETVAPLTPHSPCWLDSAPLTGTTTQHGIVRSLANWECKKQELESQMKGALENKTKREHERKETAGPTGASESLLQGTCDQLAGQNGEQKSEASEQSKGVHPTQPGQDISRSSKQHQQRQSSKDLQKTALLDTTRNTQPASGGRRRSDSLENVGVSQSTSHTDTQQPPPSPNRSVSGKKLCSSCGHPLGKGAAMIIETLSLYFHIQCFKCGICKGQLGDTTTGTDVRIRNGLLNCHQCYIRSRSAGQPTTL